MTHEELIAFRDKVALPKLMELFDNTKIPEGACYVDSITVGFLDGRSCGYETQMKASGFQYLNGKVQKYDFEEMDIDLQKFAQVHKDSIFVSDGKLRVFDELSELDLTTTIRNVGICGKLFPAFENAPILNTAFSPVPYYKMEYLWNNRTDVVNMDTHDFKIDGFMGTWRAVDYIDLDGSSFYLMNCETWGVELPGVIVDASGNVILEDIFEGLDEDTIEDLKDFLFVEKIYADISQQLTERTSETSYGEPQAWFYLENGRSVEITLEQNMLSADQQYYLVKLHANEKEYDAGEFHNSVGILNQALSKTDSLEEVKGLLYNAVLCNKMYPVKDCYSMDVKTETLEPEHAPLDSMIQNASAQTAREKAGAGAERGPAR